MGGSMEKNDRITRMELMKFLERFSQFSIEEQEEMADTFSHYDREIQEEFIRNLPRTIDEADLK